MQYCPTSHPAHSFFRTTWTYPTHFWISAAASASDPSSCCSRRGCLGSYSTRQDRLTAVPNDLNYSCGAVSLNSHQSLIPRDRCRQLVILEGFSRDRLARSVQRRAQRCRERLKIAHRNQRS